MSKINTNRQLKETILLLLDETITKKDVEKHINDIHNFFESITLISGFDHKLEHLAAVPLSKGKALGLNYAAQCLLDYQRTLKFLRSMVKTINTKKKQHSNIPIQIFYAGCGPYAPFISLIAPLYSSDEIQFSLLEVNKASMDAAKRLITALFLNDFVNHYYITDAVTFKVPDPKQYHILFSETLDALLYRESYVPILKNLLPQFHSDITLLPNNVILKATLLAKASQLTKNKDVTLGSVFNVKETISLLNETSDLKNIIPCNSFSFENINLNNFQSILIDTIVDVGNEYTLERNESSLTLASEILLTSHQNANKIKFTYQLEPQIELKYHFE